MVVPQLLFLRAREKLSTNDATGHDLNVRGFTNWPFDAQGDYPRARLLYSSRADNTVILTRERVIPHTG